MALRGGRLGEFRDFEAFAIVSVKHPVCGIVADEAFGLRVDAQVCAQGERGGREIDGVFAEMLRHATEGFGEFSIVTDGGLDLVNGCVFAQPMGDIGDVTEGCGDVTFLAFAGESRAFPASNGFQEVRGVRFHFALCVRG